MQHRKWKKNSDNGVTPEKFNSLSKCLKFEYRKAKKVGFYKLLTS